MFPTEKPSFCGPRLQGNLCFRLTKAILWSMPPMKHMSLLNNVHSEVHDSKETYVSAEQSPFCSP